VPELALALCIVLGWAVVGLLPRLVELGTLFGLSATLVLGGLGVGLPAALVYHVLLGRALARAGPAPRRWWLDPVRHHRDLPKGSRLGVLVWFGLGGTGFLLTMLGCVLLLAAALA
jgi:hypothetical protein